MWAYSAPIYIHIGYYAGTGSHVGLQQSLIPTASTQRPPPPLRPIDNNKLSFVH